MNLYFRLIWTLLRTLWLPKHDLYQPIERTFRVLPTDLDLNGHMNNGRYLTVVDLMLVEFFTRTGFAKILIKQRWRPVSGGAVVSFRKGLKLFQKYRIVYEWIGSNEHWNFLQYQFFNMNGDLCASGLMKGAAISSQGLVENQQSFDLLGVAYDSKVIPDSVHDWLASEEKIMNNAGP